MPFNNMLLKLSDVMRLTNATKVDTIVQCRTIRNFIG